MNGSASLYIEITVKASFKGVTGHWTKYGGSIKDIYYGNGSSKPIDDVWTCQSCGDKQPCDLTPYLFEYPEKEYIRICWQCKIDNCFAFLQRVANSG